MTSTKMLLAVFAHPDDESLLAGGMLAAAASAGADVIIVSASRGEAGPNLGGVDRGALRQRELEQAASILGARTSVCLGFPDGSLSDDVPGLADRVADLCTDWRPDFVITFASDGWYWHPDHLAVAEAVRSAVRRQAPATSIYSTTWPRHRMTRLVRAAHDRGLGTGLWGLSPAAFGSPPSEIDVVLDVTAFTRRKLTAIAAHESQVEHGALFGSLPDDLAGRYLGQEFLRLEHAATSDFARLLRTAGVGVRERAVRGRTSPSVAASTR